MSGDNNAFTAATSLLEFNFYITILKYTLERLNIQMETCQISYMTIEFWCTTSAGTSPRSQATASAAIGPEHSGIVWWLPASLLFALASNSGQTRENQIFLLHHIGCLLLVSLPPASTCQGPPTRAHMKPLTFPPHDKAFPFPCLP